MKTNGIRVLAVVALVAALAACGGGDGSEPAALPPPVAAAPVIGAAGGSTSEASGATVTVPAGALASDTTIRVAMDSNGAPPLPEGPLVSAVYAITPHGAQFKQAVSVTLPYNAALLPAGTEPAVATAEPGGPWRLISASVNGNGTVTAQTSGFSFFVVVPRPRIVIGGTLTPLLPELRVRYLSSDGLADWVLVPYPTQNGQVAAKKHLLRPADLAVEFTLVNAPTCNSGWRMSVDTGRKQGSSATDSIGQYIADEVTGNYWERSYLAAANGVIRVELPWTLLNRVNDRVNQFVVASLSHPYCQDSSFTFFPTQQIRPDVQVSAAVGTRRISISRHPANVTAAAGQAVVFETNVFQSGPGLGDNRVRVDWLRAEAGSALFVPIGSTFSVDTLGIIHRMTLPSVTSADNGARLRAVACVIDNASLPSDCVETSAATLTVLQSAVGPTLIQAPNAMLIRSGQTANFTVAAAGLPAPSLQWQTRAPNATGAWTAVSSGTGATTGNYTTRVLSTADNGTQYRVVASNATGSAESAAVTVSVSDLDVAPTITAQPAGLSVTAGNDAAFAIAARGTEALSYQWSKDGVALNGANSPVLRLPAVNAGQAGSYRVTVSNAAGTVTSDAALLTLSAGAPAAVAPTIVTQPVSVLVNAGNTATFAVGASGSGTLNYQWLRNGQPIAGATAAFFSIAQAAAGDAATYAVQVSNGVGAPVTSFNVTLTVNASAQATPVALLTQPSAQVQTPGGSATFAVAASGSAPISYQWLKNGAPIAGATSAVLTLIGVNGSDAANYSVTVSNPLLSVTSAPASLTVLGAPTITAQPAAAAVSAGSSATFNVTASGSALLYQWTRNGVGIAGATSASHTTAALTLADSGAVYAVFVFNGAGLAFGQGAVLSVTPAPVSIGGNVSGLTGSGLVLQNNAGDNLAVAASGAFSFAAGVAPGTPYAVTVLSQPSGQSCAVQNGSGTASAAVSNVVVSCGASGSLALVTNYLSNSLSILRANATTGALTLLGSVATGANPYAVAVSPNGLYAYVGNLTGGFISAYTIDRTNGTLAPIPSGSRVSNSPYSIAVDPLGRFLWVANYGSNTVSAFAIGQDGALAAVGAPLATGALPRSVAVHPNGNFVYVAGESSYSIAVYAVNAATGALTLRPGTVANSVLSPNAMVMHPNGTLAYVADGGSGAVAAFNVNASTGVLSVKGYFNTGSGTNAVALHPSGQFLYASTSSGVMLFAVTATGSLNVVGAATPAGTVPKGLALDGAGTHLYVTDLASGTVSAFAIDAATGALSPLGAALATGSQPSGVAITP